MRPCASLGTFSRSRSNAPRSSRARRAAASAAHSYVAHRSRRSPSSDRSSGTAPMSDGAGSAAKRRTSSCRPRAGGKPVASPRRLVRAPGCTCDASPTRPDRDRRTVSALWTDHIPRRCCYRAGRALLNADGAGSDEHHGAGPTPGILAPGPAPTLRRRGLGRPRALPGWGVPGPPPNLVRSVLSVPPVVLFRQRARELAQICREMLRGEPAATLS